MTRFAASRHLALLRAAGLMTAIERGPRVQHQLNPAAIEAIEDWLYRFVDG